MLPRNCNRPVTRGPMDIYSSDQRLDAPCPASFLSEIQRFKEFQRRPVCVETPSRKILSVGRGVTAADSPYETPLVDVPRAQVFQRRPANSRREPAQRQDFVEFSVLRSQAPPLRFRNDAGDPTFAPKRFPTEESVWRDTHVNGLFPILLKCVVFLTRCRVLTLTRQATHAIQRSRVARAAQ